MRRAFATATLAWTLALAVPAVVLTHTSFQPIDDRFSVSAGDVHDIVLASAEPLYLEYSLIVRAPAAAQVPAFRATATVTVDGARAADIDVEHLFAPVRGRILLHAPPIHAGPNRLTVVLTGATDATFQLDARVHNYYGIAPDFPRVFVVADEAVAAWWHQSSWFALGMRLVVFAIGSWMLVLALARITRSRATVASASVILWMALAYSLATPLHIWLSPGALAVLIVAGVLAGSAFVWARRHQRIVLRAAALTMVTIGALELALRAYNAVAPTYVFYSDDYNRYRGQPGAVFYDARFNSRGFNDIEHAVARLSGITRRIVALGDSFVVGVVPQRFNFLSQLRAALGADATDVINLGIAATEPRDYLAILVNEGLAYAPDLVLVNVFVGNDFEQSARRPYEFSYVATLVRAAWRYARAGPLPAAGSGASVADYRDDEPTLARDRFLEIEVDRSWVYDTRDDRLRVAVERVAGALRSMRDVTAARGAELVVVLIPDEAQVHAALQEEVARASGRPRADLDFTQPNRLLAASLDADRIRVIDLLPTFRERGASMRLYKPQDTHWNIAGNALAAETIAAALRR